MKFLSPTISLYSGGSAPTTCGQHSNWQSKSIIFTVQFFLLGHKNCILRAKLHNWTQDPWVSHQHGKKKWEMSTGLKQHIRGTKHTKLPLTWQIYRGPGKTMQVLLANLHKKVKLELNKVISVSTSTL